MDQQTNDLIKNEIENNEVCLFMKGTPDAPQCGFSMATSNILKVMEVKFKGVNVLEDQKLREGIKWTEPARAREAMSALCRIWTETQFEKGDRDKAKYDALILEGWIRENSRDLEKEADKKYVKFEDWKAMWNGDELWREYLTTYEDPEDLYRALVEQFNTTLFT